MKKTVMILLCTCLLCGCSSGTAAKKEKVITRSCLAIDSYDYTEPVPVSEAIGEDYYATAMFAGDSRMGCLSLYGNHPDAEVGYVTSLNLLMIDVMKADERDDGKTLMDLLNETDRPNIYLMFGINENSNLNFDAFSEKYQEILTTLRTNNPSVNIYIILAYHPEEISGLNADQLNTQLNALNTQLVQLAVNNYVYYLRPDDAITDENGIVIDSYVFDGLHMNPTGTKAMEDFYATHVVRSEDYVKEVCE
jgi:lysophospholipase L1-like esterase